MATHHEIETSPVIRGKCPLLGEAASNIGDIQVRNMGTIGGSVAHADPAADYPAALVALEAQYSAAFGASGERTVEASEFFLDAFTTAMEPGEIIVAVEMAAEEPSEGYKYEKVPHPASGFPVVGVAVRVKKAGAGIAMARIGVTGMGPHAFRARKAEAMLEGGAATAAAAAVVGEGEDTNSDLYASGDYRRHLARVHAARAIAPRSRGPREIGGTYPLPFPQERAYALLQDPAVLASACRAARAWTRVGEGEYAMQMKMVLAAISGRFDGKVRITEAQPPTQFRLHRGRRGKNRFHERRAACLTFSAADNGTSVQYDGDVQVGGTHRVRGAAADGDDREDADQAIFRQAGGRRGYRRGYRFPTNLRLAFQRLAHKHQLAHVVRIVVSHQQYFPQQRLARTMFEPRRQIRIRVGNQFFHGLRVFLELRHAGVPSGIIWRRFGARPVVVGPRLLFVVGIAAEIENVFLRDPQVLQQLPRCVRRSRDLLAAKFRREALDRGIEIRMGTLHPQQIDEMFQ